MRKRKTDQEKLYASRDRRGYVTIKVPFDNLLLSALGYYNALKPEDRPNLEFVEIVKSELHGLLMSHRI